MNTSKILTAFLAAFLSGTALAVNNYWGGTAEDSVSNVQKWWYNGTVHQLPSGDDTITLNRESQPMVVRAGDTLRAAGLSLMGRKGETILMRVEGGSVALTSEVDIGQNTGSGDLNWGMGAVRLEITGGVLSLPSGKYFYTGRNCEAFLSVSGSGTLDVTGANFYLSKDWSANRGRGTLVVENGGTLKIGQIMPDDDSKVYFRGAKLVFGTSANVFHDSYVNKNWKLWIGDGGLSVDTQGHDVTFNRAMIAEEGSTEGGFVKKGAGTFTFSAGNTWKPGPVVIEAGKVVAPGCDALPGYASHGISLAAGATLELGQGWSLTEVNVIKAQPTVQGTVTYTVLNANDLTAGNYGTSKTADSLEVFTGSNDFGGRFTIEKGTLAADFGQGLAATDNLQIGASATTSVLPAFSPISGSVAQSLGTGAGQIALFPGAAAGFTANAAETTVRLNGGAELVRGAEGFNVPWLILNDDRAHHDLTLENPLDLNGGPLCIYTGSARAELAGQFRNSTGSGNFAKRGAGELHVKQGLPAATYYLYGGLVSVPAKTTSTIAELVVNGGSLAVGAGSTINQSAKATVQNGTVVLTNCTYTYTTGDFYVKGGLLHILGGTFNYNNADNWFQTESDGEFRMDGCTATFKSQLTVGRTNASTGKSVVTVCGGAQVDTTGPGTVVQNGTLVVDGEGTLLKTKALIQGAHQDWMKDSTINGRGDIIVKGGTVQTSDDLVIARGRSSVGSLRVSGGTIKVAAGKSFVISDCGDATFEITGGLVDAGSTYGMMFMPGWNPGSWSEVEGRGRRSYVRLVGGELKASRATCGSSSYDVTFVFDGGRMTRCGNSEVEFNNIQKLRVSTKGGTYDAGSNPVRMFGPLLALEGEEPEVLSAADYNEAPAFTKRGTGTVTLVGANDYACATAVREGELKLADGASLPSGQIVRMEGGALDLGGASQTALALTGSGTVKNGGLTATDAVYPGGVGTVGTLTLSGCTLADGSAVVFDLSADGQSSDALVFTGAVDLSKLTIRIANPEKVVRVKSYTLLTAASVSGRPTVENVPKGFGIRVTDTGLRMSRNGLAVLIR